MTEKKTVTIDHLTKVEGHATLHVKVEDGKVRQCRLTSIEGSRYFEGMLKGRRWDEAFEITSRICGICSTGHVVCALQAMEDALGVKPSKQTVLLRELMTISEKIRSHATHLYFLALPDYMGYESAIAMVPKFKKEIELALRLMRLGNDMLVLLGGREMHVVQGAVGGFRKFPTEEQLLEVAKRLKAAKPDSMMTAKLIGSLKIPDFELETKYLSLVGKSEIGLLSGDLVSAHSRFKKDDMPKFLSESHESDSTANFVVKEGKAYFTSALARLNNASKWLSTDAKKALKASKIKLPSKNPFLNNFCQALELVHYIDRAITICKTMKPKKETLAPVTLRAGHGIGVIEVPRGLLWHEYEIDEVGMIVRANIITPTCQNLRNMNEDIAAYLQTILHLPQDTIKLEIEKLIRAYDPCFSCSTHFLEIEWE